VTPVFADTYYFLALLAKGGPDHSRALRVTNEIRRRLLTTEWILVEVGDAMASPSNRLRFGELVNYLRSRQEVEIRPASTSLLNQGLDLYLRRPDKDWTLTDCISFVVMEQEGITESLTADHHFAQAGFKTLL
jgi:predicted nucleic acid-binding protein